MGGGNLINVLFCGLLVQKTGRFSLSLPLMTTPEGIPYGWREHSLKEMIPRSLSILRSKGFYLPCVWEGHGGRSLGRNEYFEIAS